MEYKKKSTVIKTFLLYAILNFAVLSAPVYAEYLMMKDGSIVEGKILDETESGISINIKNGGRQLVKHRELLRIIYSSDFMNRIFVFLADGSVIEGYIVEETTTTYRIREDLNSPEEKLIQKSDVLNVSAQKISAKKTSRLAVTDFRGINIPPAEAGKFSASARLELTAGGYFIVLSGDQMKDLYKEKKKNIPQCYEPSCAVEMGEILSVNFVLIGSVEPYKNGYLIKAQMIDVETGSIMFEEETEAANKNDISGSAKRLAEKFNVRIELHRIREDIKEVITFKISADFVYASTVGRMKDLSSSGMGGLITFSLDVYRSYNVGFCIGYIYYDGTRPMTKSFTISPVAFTAGYNWYPFKNFYLKPFVTAGGALVTLTQDMDGIEIGGKAEYLSSSNLEPYVSTGIELGYNYRHNFVFKAGAAYNAIVESDVTLSYLTYFCGAGYRF